MASCRILRNDLERGDLSDHIASGLFARAITARRSSASMESFDDPMMFVLVRNSITGNVVEVYYIPRGSFILTLKIDIELATCIARITQKILRACEEEAHVYYFITEGYDRYSGKEHLLAVSHYHSCTAADMGDVPGHMEEMD